MRLKFTEHPVHIDEAIYHRAIQRMAGILMDTGLVKCVYQVGGVSSPGISDLDLYVVFKNDTIYNENPVSSLEFPDKYLFSHKLFGTSEQLAPTMERFTFFGKYNLIAGEQIDMFSYLPSAEDIKILKPQIALEYLVKAWISVSTGIIFNTIKLRSFLLHAKAVQYDLNFLEIKNEGLSVCINRIIDIRNSWFKNQPSDTKLNKLVYEYRENLLKYIQQCISKYNFYLPDEANHKIAGRISLQNSNQIKLTRNGIMLPSILTSKSKTLFKINNRLNNFSAEIPIKSENIPSIMQERYNVLKSAFEYNQTHLPYFICTGHGLDIFRSRTHYKSHQSE